MKPVILCALIIMLVGCSHNNAVKAPSLPPPPGGLVKLLEDNTGGTYADMRSISTYQGNPHLRRFYLINNYVGPHQMKAHGNVYISSSTVINVVNCDTSQRAQFERLYFSDYWGQGELMAKRAAIGQWEPFPQQSLLGLIATTVCKIAPENLKAEPARESRQPLLGDFN